MRFTPPPQPPGEPDSGPSAGLRSQPSLTAQLVIWGAHGGAGTTTLAIWLQPAWDMGAMRPGPRPGYPAGIAGSRPLVVTCRPTAGAAQAATAAVTVAARAGGRVAVLAVVSDGWPEADAAASRFRLLQPQVGVIVRVPFVPGLRLADDPAGVPLPRRVIRALDEIRAATGRNPHLT